jgi:glycosyltransferase involved in cell wall biosynthesis
MNIESRREQSRTRRDFRVLWFTNIPMPAVDRRTGNATSGSGHWMSALLAPLAEHAQVSLGVATSYPGLPDLEFEEDGVRYFVQGQPRFQSHFHCRRRDLEGSRAIVERFRPDLIHVHGSERFFGLLGARQMVAPPLVVSLQGILRRYLPEFFGAMSKRDILRSLRLRELATRRGLAWDYLAFSRGARQEDEILRGAAAFLGRTAWDEAHLRRVNPSARYFRVDEVLRPEFAKEAWSLARCRRHTLFVSNAGSPWRGIEVALDAVESLSRRWPDVELRIAGRVDERSGYGRALRARVRASGLAGRVRFLGFLDAGALARELATAGAFAMASYAENSPNSLCEAMRVGVPCVASYAGGIPSLLCDEATGLLFPRGDAPLLASQLDRLFRDDALAARLGGAASVVAAQRHNPDRILRQLLDAYEALVGRRDGLLREVA